MITRTFVDLKNDFLDEFKNVVAAYGPEELTEWLDKRVTTLVNDSVLEVEVPKIPLDREYTEEEKIKLKEEMNENSNTDVLQGRAYGFNQAIEKYDENKVAFFG